MVWRQLVCIASIYESNIVHAGVIPFIALSPPVAASLPLIPADLLQNAALLQVAYGASIASFLGGIHWAMAMAEYGGLCFHCCMACMICGDATSTVLAISATHRAAHIAFLNKLSCNLDVRHYKGALW